jgi:hypothetical protein
MMLNLISTKTEIYLLPSLIIIVVINVYLVAVSTFLAKVYILC